MIKLGGERLFAAYLGAVVFAVITGVVEQRWAFIQDFQTLLVGVPGLIALLVALNRLRAEARGYATSVLHFYEPEYELLDELRVIASDLQKSGERKVIGEMIGARSGTSIVVPDVKDRLALALTETRGAVRAQLSALKENISFHDAIIDGLDKEDGPMTTDEREFAHQAEYSLKEGAKRLQVAVDERRRVIRERIDLYTGRRL